MSSSCRGNSNWTQTIYVTGKLECDRWSFQKYVGLKSCVCIATCKFVILSKGQLWLFIWNCFWLSTFCWSRPQPPILIEFGRNSKLFCGCRQLQLENAFLRGKISIKYLLNCSLWPNWFNFIYIYTMRFEPDLWISEQWHD